MKKSHFTIQSACLLALFATGGCRFSLQERYEHFMQELVEDGQKPQSPVIAKVGDISITEEEYWAYANRDGGRTAQGTKRVFPTNVAMSPQPDILFRLIDLKLLVSAAKKEGYLDSPEYKGLVGDVQAGILQSRVMRQLGKPTDAEVLSYYNSHKRDYQFRVQITASRFILKTQKSAEEALRMLKSGRELSDVVNAMVKADTLISAGRIPPYYKGQGDPAVEKIVTGLGVGQYSKIMPSGKTFEFYWKERETPVPGMSPDQAKAAIRGLLESQRLSDYMKKLRAQIKVEIIAPQTQPSPAPTPTASPKKPAK